jgi:NitT/TauT family transport system substrate-binding protein
MLAGTAAALALAPRPLRAQALTKVRLAGVFTDDLTPVFWALRTGMYQKAGIDLEMVAANSGTAATTAVVSGTYELGKGSNIAALAAHLRGLPITIVANGVMWDAASPVSVQVVATDSPYQAPKDLNGKIGAATGLNDIVVLVICQWIDRNGGDSKSMKWVEIPQSALAAALEAHRIDICMLNEPYYTAAAMTGKVRRLNPGYTLSVIADHYPVAIYFSHRDFAAKNPQLVRNFARVTYESAAYTNAHHDETAQMMSEVTKLPVETIRKMSRPPSATSGEPALIQPVIDIAAKYGYIPRAFPAKEAYFSA